MYYQLKRVCPLFKVIYFMGAHSESYSYLYFLGARHKTCILSGHWALRHRHSQNINERIYRSEIADLEQNRYVCEETMLQFHNLTDSFA